MTDPIIHALVEAGSEPHQPREPEARTTEAVVASMLRENTGRHMLDSGGAYGRNWEHNQSKDFEQALEVDADWRWAWIDVTLDLYHFLTTTLEYEPELDRLFEAWCNEGERARESWYVLQDEFIELLRNADDGDPGPPFDAFLATIHDNPYTGEDFRAQPWSVNTYNHESLLSQVIQYAIVGDIVFLQVHGGCDVRGGYTQPRVFRLYEDWPSFLDDQQATISCEDGCAVTTWGNYVVHSNWHTDDGYHWYFDGGTGDTQLEEYPAEDISTTEGFAKWRARRIVIDVLNDRGEDLGKLLPIRAYHSEDNYSLCPNCDTGKLVAGY